MAELIREIEEADLPQLQELMTLVFGDGHWRDIERLGGMTNHSYKITRTDGEEYLVRLPGEGTEEMINRQDERKSTALACKLGIDSPLLYFGGDGRKVMKFIHDPQPMSDEVMRRPEILRQAAAIFRKLHTCGEDTGVRFEVFEMADLYERIIREGGVAFYADYDAVKKTVMDIKAAVDGAGIAPRVPCHNDSLVGNWVLDGEGKLYLVDWEYSGMNEAMWDLSCLSIEADYANEQDDALLEAYYGRPATVEEKKRFIAAKLYVDYLWTLWGLTRVPFDGDFMQDYADGRFWLGFAGTIMCAFGWGIEAVIIARCVQDDAVTDEIALQIRQTTSALVYGIVILPLMKGWGFTCSLFSGSGWLMPTIVLAALFATASYLFYYRAIAQIGASKSMALNITYCAWAVVFTVVFLRDMSLLNPVTILCTIAVLVFGILAGADYKDLLKKKNE